MSSEWCVLWLSVKVTLHVNMLTMLRDLKKVLHGITCHGHMAPVGLFHFEEMVNIVNMKGHRAGLTSVKLHVSMTRADVALGALNWVVTHTNTQSRTMRLPRGYRKPFTRSVNKLNLDAVVDAVGVAGEAGGEPGGVGGEHRHEAAAGLQSGAYSATGQKWPSRNAAQRH